MYACVVIVCWLRCASVVVWCVICLWLLFVVRCVMLVGCCLMCVIFAVFDDRGSFIVVCCLLLVVCCLLFAVVCFLVLIVCRWCS